MTQNNNKDTTRTHLPYWLFFTYPFLNLRGLS